MKQKERQKIEVHRTTEGTIFEVAFLVLTVIVWAIIIWQVSKAPNVIATHFDMNGHPNGYGSPWGLMFPCIITTVVGACLLAAAYFPHTINVPVEVKTPRQYELLIRMTRIIAMIMLLLTLAIPMTLLVFSSPQTWPVFGIIALIIAVIIYYCVQIYKAK